PPPPPPPPPSPLMASPPRPSPACSSSTPSSTELPDDSAYASFRSFSPPATPGHYFVALSNITRIACSAYLVPMPFWITSENHVVAGYFSSEGWETTMDQWNTQRSHRRVFEFVGMSIHLLVSFFIVLLLPTFELTHKIWGVLDNFFRLANTNAALWNDGLRETQAVAGARGRDP
ncbi:MAG: hypothetical protein Q8P67_27980, partial [archaeon]|nr:hypothetical protein [archaeon]